MSADWPVNRPSFGRLFSGSVILGQRRVSPFTSGSNLIFEGVNQYVSVDELARSVPVQTRLS